METTLYNLLMAAVVITAIALAWFSLHYLLNALMENPDGTAKVTGSCGDTMEIGLKFNGPQVENVHCWTDGCAISKMCIETVGMLVRGKTVPEIQAIDTAAILERVGNLPDTHLHCAVLAEETLQKAVKDYLLKNPNVESCGLKRRGECPPGDGRGPQAGAPPMAEPNYVVYLFPSSNYVMKAEKILKELGIAHKIIPVPRHLSSDCGVCLRIAADREGAVTDALGEKVAWQHVATL